MSTNQNRFFAVVKLPTSVPSLLKASAGIVAGMTGNAFFPSAAALVAALGKAVAALDAAETATKARTRGTVAARNAARTALISQLHAAKALVQQVADADPEHAQAMIASAGMGVRKATSHRKAPFVALQGATSGAVRLVAKAAAHRASYDWQWSPDGGKTWAQLPLTLQSKTTVAGVPVGTTAQFRFRAVTRAGQGDWSQPVALLVT